MGERCQWDAQKRKQQPSTIIDANGMYKKIAESHILLQEENEMKNQSNERIARLCSGWVEGQADLKIYITNYWKSPFRLSNEGDFTFDNTRMHDIPQVTAKENDILTLPFFEEEMRVVVFQMKHDKAPGLDGCPPKFY